MALSPVPWYGPSVGRICRWYSPDAQIVAVSLDMWDLEGDLQTVRVVTLGPFDDPFITEQKLKDLLMSAPPLF